MTKTAHKPKDSTTFRRTGWNSRMRSTSRARRLRALSNVFCTLAYIAGFQPARAGRHPSNTAAIAPILTLAALAQPFDFVVYSAGDLVAPVLHSGDPDFSPRGQAVVVDLSPASLVVVRASSRRPQTRQRPLGIVSRYSPRRSSRRHGIQKPH